jgi:small subunit ribosomal protein S2
MSEIPSLKEMLEAGVHFGHETKRWNPKMSTYIFGAREKIHVIDLEKTEQALRKAVDFVEKLASEGKEIIFLATKKQASDILKSEAERVGAMYMVSRWVGGLFTNFEEVRKTIKKMDELEEKAKDNSYTKREQLLFTRKLKKLERYVGGVRKMEALPGAIFVVDAKKEDNAVLEARKMGIPVVAIVDTNADPTKIDYPIPANDDAIRSIALIVKTIANAFEQGRNRIKDEELITKMSEKEEKSKIQDSKPRSTTKDKEELKAASKNSKQETKKKEIKKTVMAKKEASK